MSGGAPQPRRPVAGDGDLCLLGASHDLAHRPSALEREFGSELSPPGIDHGGETYLDKGDGLIAMWNQADAFRCAAISGL